MFAKLNHIAIASDQYAINARFYEALFGLRSAKNYRPARAAVVSDGRVGMNLIPRREGRTSGLDHFGFQVADLDEAIARITKLDPSLTTLQRPPVRPSAACCWCITGCLSCCFRAWLTASLPWGRGGISGCGSSPQ